MKRLLISWGIILALAVGVCWAGSKAVHEQVDVTLPIVTHLGDAAQVSKRTPVVAVDSFAYIDTFSYHADTTAHKTITWTSHPQRMRLTPSTVWDEARTIRCSLLTATVQLGFLVDPAVTYTTGAKIVDTLTYLINNTTGMKDSILAVDSGTYVKLIDKNTGKYRTARWTIKIVLAGGATSTLDTLTSPGYITTIAQICDSMVAKINASANLDSFLTAYDSTTFYITKSDNPGVLFWDSSKCDPDTHATVARSQANVKGWSYKADTIRLEQVIPSGTRGTPILGTQYRGGKFVIFFDSLTGANAGKQGVGIVDSVYLQLLAGFWRTTVNGTRTMTWTVIKGDTCTSTPCSLKYARSSIAAGSDTAWGTDLAIWYRVADSSSDSTFNVYHRLYLDYFLVGED